MNLIAYDLGTGGVKASLYDKKYKLLPKHLYRIKHGIRNPFCMNRNHRIGGKVLLPAQKNSSTKRLSMQKTSVLSPFPGIAWSLFPLIEMEIC